eukprot:319971_1
MDKILFTNDIPWMYDEMMEEFIFRVLSEQLSVNINTVKDKPFKEFDAYSTSMFTHYFETKKSVGLQWNKKNWPNMNKIMNILLDPNKEHIRLNVLLNLFPNVEEVDIGKIVFDKYLWDLLKEIGSIFDENGARKLKVIRMKPCVETGHAQLSFYPDWWFEEWYLRWHLYVVEIDSEVRVLKYSTDELIRYLISSRSDNFVKYDYSRVRLSCRIRILTESSNNINKCVNNDQVSDDREQRIFHSFCERIEDLYVYENSLLWKSIKHTHSDWINIQYIFIAFPNLIRLCIINIKLHPFVFEDLLKNIKFYKSVKKFQKMLTRIEITLKNVVYDHMFPISLVISKYKNDFNDIGMAIDRKNNDIIISPNERSRKNKFEEEKKNEFMKQNEEYIWSIFDKDIIKELKCAPNMFVYTSDIFMLHGLRYFIAFYPNGWREERIGKYCIFLHCLEKIASYHHVKVQFVFNETNVQKLKYWTIDDDNNYKQLFFNNNQDIEDLNSFTFTVNIKMLADDYSIDKLQPLEISETRLGVFCWRIPYDLLNNMKEAEIGQMFDSEMFEMFGMKWYLSCYPNGMNQNRDNAGFVILCINNVTLPVIESVVSVKYTMCVNERYKNVQCGYFDYKNRWRRWGTRKTPDILSTNTFKGLNYLSIKLEMLLIDALEYIKYEENVTLNNNTNEIEFKLWCYNTLKLPKYHDIFIKNGINTLQMMSLINMSALEEMNIVNIQHRARILIEIANLLPTLSGDSEFK